MNTTPTPKKYVVQPGFSFRLPDGKVAGEGAVIELAEEVIKANPGCVLPHVEEEAPEAGEEGGTPPAAPNAGDANPTAQS